MAHKYHAQPLIPGYATEVEQELHNRLTIIQTTLTPQEPVRLGAIQLSSISLLPNEILIPIFQHGLSEVPNSANSLPMPNAIAGVCKRWRAVVIGTPELWTRVFVTSATPSDHLLTYLERAKNFKVNVDFCHWPAAKRGNDVNSNEAFLESIVGTLRCHAHRLRNLSLWDISDTAACTVLSGLKCFNAPYLINVSVKANHTVLHQYYQLRHLYLLPFLDGGATSLTHLEIDHFPIETFRTRSDWQFNVHNLTSLTLRTKESPIQDFHLPPYLIEFPALCALLCSTPRLTSLALYGPVIEPDEDFPIRPPGATLPFLETLIIHRHLPGVRYHCELLNVLTMPALKHLEIPWHDDLSVEFPNQDRTADYLFDGHGVPRFAGVKKLYLHDSAARRMMPTRSLVKAFPHVEEVVLGGTDVPKFASTLRGFVLPALPAPDSDSDSDSDPGMLLAEGGWRSLERVVLKAPDMTCWKGWVRGLCKWLAARGRVGLVCVEIQDGCLQQWDVDDRTVRAFRRGLDRLGKYAVVDVKDTTSTT